MRQAPYARIIGLVARCLGAAYARERAVEVQHVPLQIRRANPAEIVLADQVAGIGSGITDVAEQGHLREVSLVLADLAVAGSKAPFGRANIGPLRSIDAGSPIATDAGRGLDADNS